MSLEADNVAVVRRFYEVYSAHGDWEELFKLMSPDIEMEPDPRHPRAGTHRGYDEYREFLQEFEEPFEHATMEPERLFARGDTVVAYVHTRRRPYGSSIEMENRIGFLWTLRDGLIVREQVFGEREKALAAAGLSEADAVD